MSCTALSGPTWTWPAGKLHVRGDVKTEDSERILTIDVGTAGVAAGLTGETQLFERLEWDTGWTDSGRVFTREDSAPLRPGHISEHLEVLISRAGPPIRLHR